MSGPGSDEAGANGAVEHSGAGVVEHPLPVGAVHLSAHEVVQTAGPHRLDPTYTALCGEPVDATSHSSGQDCPDECECEERGGIAFCPACVREALRWKAQDEDRGYVIGECGHRRPLYLTGHVGGCECDQAGQLRDLATRDGR